MLGIFGGTFDPIHLGHLLPVRQAATEIGLTQVALLPCHIPVHRQTPKVSAEQRLTMVQLACQDYPLFYPDDREIRRHSPSYTHTTLTEYHQQNPAQSVCFFVGMDSFNQFHQWHRWQEILQLCHLIVCPRPGFPVSDHAKQLLQQHGCQESAMLKEQQAGCIYIADAPLTDVAATDIRQRLATGENCQDILSPRVFDYIRTNQLYLQQDGGQQP